MKTEAQQRAEQAIKQKLEQQKVRLEVRSEELAAQLARLEVKNDPSYSKDVTNHFPLGMVGGSGRRTHAYNVRRERDPERTTAHATKVTALRDDLSRTKAALTTITSGQALQKAYAKIALKSRANRRREKYDGAADDQRLFRCKTATGFAFSDCLREERGDFKHLAFLSYSRLELTWYVNPDRYNQSLIKQIKSEVDCIRAKRGERQKTFTFDEYGLALGYGLRPDDLIPPDIKPFSKMS
jgi:DNA repair exonuclease SbcCD ATPase subunit